jgi:pyridoxal phosphate enzyme (YggS family)
MPSEELCQRLAQVARSIHTCEKRHNREVGSVALIAVSKKKSVTEIRGAVHCGQQKFGESYAQEFHDKALQLTDLPIEWHFIGPVQSNKTRLIAQHAHWVHSIDRIKIASRLASQRPKSLPPLNICLQVNIDSEAGKSGVDVNEVPELAQQVQQIEGLQLRGLMCIPRRTSKEELQRDAFARLRRALEHLNNNGFALDTLSMGMSGDYPAAIAEGATMIRVGTAIFGPRT